MYLKLSILLFFVKNVISAKILAVMTLASHSHHLFNCKYLEGLAARGHEITYLNIDEYKNPPKNIKHFYVPGVYEKAYAGFDFTTITDMGSFTTVITLPLWEEILANILLNSTELKEFIEIIKTEKYDLVVSEFGMSPLLLGAAHFSKAPVMGITAFGIPQRVSDLLGSPFSQAINPHGLTSYGENMSVFERLNNFVLYTLNQIANYFIEIDEVVLVRKIFGDEVDIREILNRVNVILVNANLATDPKIPMVPGLIPIGGLQIEEPKALPKDLQKYLDDAKDGVIYFSLGSNVPSSTLNKKIAMFTEAFRRLAPVKILWKYDDENFPGKPDNVKVQKWLPQNDILAHPNVKLFFTHSGMLSTHEAIYHGVPIVAMPIFLDQHSNADKSVRQGIGEKLRFSALTTDDLYGALRKVLDDPKYTEKVKQLSAIYRDYPDKPLDRAIYWTEYVIRHKGAPHLRTASRNLYWFQNWLIDILLIITLATTTIILVIYKLVKLIIPSKKPKKPKQKKN